MSRTRRRREGRRGRLTRLALLGIVVGSLGADGTPPHDPLNDFSLTNLRVPRESIRGGGPKRDQIRAVDAPEFVAASEATWVMGDTAVIGVELDGVAHLYPVHLMEYHQVVNDNIAGIPILLSYDPLSGTPLAYRRKLADRILEFGVSGLIRNSNFLLYDRATESLWSQFDGRALAGALAGSRLERVRTRQESLTSWLARAPEGRVLVPPEPGRFDYRYSPYSSYWVENKIPFPVDSRDDRFHAKELALGVREQERSRAYLGSVLTEAGGTAVDEFEGHRIRVEYDSDLGIFRYWVPDSLEVTEAYWFAWKANHPDTEIWEPKADAAE
jgi:hypothetical protein